MSKVKKIGIIIILTIAAVGIGGVFFHGFIRTKYIVPIFMYHQVIPKIDPNNKVTVSVDTFEKQMRFLRGHNYNVLPLEEVIALIRNKQTVPPRTLAVTFDDGYIDNYKYAFPILKKYGIPATIFIIAEEVGRINSGGVHDRLDWEQIKTMQNSGLITIGSHAVGPQPLDRIKSEAELRHQIFDSKRILEEKLGTNINTFSYPEGKFNSVIRRLVIEAGYTAAVATKLSKGYPKDDVFALRRLRIAENAGNSFVLAVQASGYYTFFKENKRRHEKK